MGEAKRRKAYLDALASEPIPKEGLFLSAKKEGVHAMVVIQHPAEGGATAGLFCVDSWQEGLFQCLGKTYNSVAQFQEEFKRSAERYKPTGLEECRHLVAWGLQIREKARAPIPTEFQKWKHLLGSLPPPPPYLYGCPECDAPLPQDLCQTILESVGKNMTCYMVCEACR